MRPAPATLAALREDGTLSAPRALGAYYYDASSRLYVPNFGEDFRTIGRQTTGDGVAA